MPSWVRSSACADKACVEAAYVPFVKSSYSTTNATCVEAAPADGRILVRDGKDPDGPVLSYTMEEWNAFLAGVRSGEFDFE